MSEVGMRKGEYVSIGQKTEDRLEGKEGEKLRSLEGGRKDMRAAGTGVFEFGGGTRRRH